jgi:hypothetical protein
MARTHVFVIVVLLAAAAFAGLLALTRTTQQSATASPALDAQIAARTRSLDRLEKSLRHSLAKRMPALPARPAGSSRPAAPRTVYVRSSAAPATAHGEHEAEHGDDGHGQGYEQGGGDD